MSEELKPCPFCGSDPIRVINPFGILYAVKCLECGAEGSYMKTVEQAIEAWNSRCERTCTMLHGTAAGLDCYKCDECDNVSYTTHAPNYCPNCGAKVVEQ